MASSNLSDTGTLVRNTGSYANPAWLASVDGGKISGALNNVSIGATTPSAINATNVTAQSVVTSQSPMVDIRAFGAVIDGVTPIDSAFQSALTAACAGAGAVLLPCSGAGCKIQNGSSFGDPSGYACGPGSATTVQIQVQGTLKLASTLVMPDGTDVICGGAGQRGLFQGPAPTCNITGPPVYGTLGTAITGGVTSQSFTPSSIAGFYVGGAITVAEATTCTITSISRASNMVTAVLSSSCRIPAGTTVTIAGVADPSYNGTYIPVIKASFPSNTLTLAQSGANSSSSGGTIAGLNDNTFETVRITAVSGSTATATFIHPHPATAQFGMVALSSPTGTYTHHSFKGLSVGNFYGGRLLGGKLDDHPVQGCLFWRDGKCLDLDPHGVRRELASVD